MSFRKTMTTTMIAVAFLLAVAIPSGFCGGAAKIGTVNFQRIFENSTAGKAARDKINAEGKRMQADLKKKGDEIKTMQKRLDDDAGVMSQDAREDQKWNLERKIDDVKALREKYNRRIQELQAQLVNEVRKNVLQIVQDYGKKEGYTLILEDISVVYAPQSYDLTDQIVKIYNKQYAKQGKKN
jgi:outer membrane protein